MGNNLAWLKINMSFFDVIFISVYTEALTNYDASMELIRGKGFDAYAYQPIYILQKD